MHVSSRNCARYLWAEANCTTERGSKNCAMLTMSSPGRNSSCKRKTVLFTMQAKHCCVAHEVKCSMCSPFTHLCPLHWPPLLTHPPSEFQQEHWTGMWPFDTHVFSLLKLSKKYLGQETNQLIFVHSIFISISNAALSWSWIKHELSHCRQLEWQQCRVGEGEGHSLMLSGRWWPCQIMMASQ